MMTADTRACTGGLLPVDKPGGMTSHDVVAAIRKLVRPLRVGHTGTLDPIASGLLVLCVGTATRIAGFVESRYKLYRATALLGVQTDTLDVSGQVNERIPVKGISEDSVRETAHSFMGKIEQIPPSFSAIKIDGVRSYKLARQRKEIRLKPRTVHISRLEVERVMLPRIQLLVECSKGTYVRALCRDLGEALGVGGCMESLRRLAVGDLTLENAVRMDDLDSKEKVVAALRPTLDAVTHLPALHVTATEAERIAHGVRLLISGKAETCESDTSWAKALGPNGELIAVGRFVRDGESVLFQPRKVLTSCGE